MLYPMHHPLQLHTQCTMDRRLQLHTRQSPCHPLRFYTMRVPYRIMLCSVYLCLLLSTHHSLLSISVKGIQIEMHALLPFPHNHFMLNAAARSASMNVYMFLQLHKYFLPSTLTSNIIHPLCKHSVILVLLVAISIPQVQHFGNASLIQLPNIHVVNVDEVCCGCL